MHSEGFFAWSKDEDLSMIHKHSAQLKDLSEFARLRGLSTILYLIFTAANPVSAAVDYVRTALAMC